MLHSKDYWKMRLTTQILRRRQILLLLDQVWASAKAQLVLRNPSRDHVGSKESSYGEQKSSSPAGFRNVLVFSYAHSLIIFHIVCKVQHRI